MKTTVKVCIGGASGGVGRCLVKAVLASDDLVLTGATSRRHAGHDIGLALGNDESGVVARDSLEAALEPLPDVLIDYTHPDVRMSHARLAVARRVPMVIGTTGFTAAEFAELDRDARAAGIGLATGNFSMTAALLQHFALIAARHLPHWTIIDYCKADKPDVPSGTARELAELMSAVRQPEHALVRDAYIGYRDALGADIDGGRVHSVRLPGYIAGAEVRFGLSGERLTLQHEMGERNEIFVEGSLLAARKVLSQVGLVRGLDKLLFPHYVTE